MCSNMCAGKTRNTCFEKSRGVFTQWPMRICAVMTARRWMLAVYGEFIIDSTAK